MQARNFVQLVLAFMIGFAVGSPGHADEAPDCALTRYASLDIRADNKDRVLVPIKIGQQDETFIVDTGSPISELTDSAVTELGLEKHMMSRGYEVRSLQGARSQETVFVPLFKLGDVNAKGFRFVVFSKKLDASAVGLLGSDIIGRYDVEFDFAANKMNLYSPDHCSGKVIFWTHAPYAAIPFHLGQSHHILIPIKLDDVSLTAAVDTGAPSGVSMSIATARSLFGWRTDPPELKQINAEPLQYTYPFKLVSLGGASVQNPTIHLDEKFDTRVGGTQALVGLAALRAFHVYISYAEQMIYLTARDAH